MKHYLITGGTGMVGHHLVDRILQRESAQITILTRSDKVSQNNHITYVNWSKDGWEQEIGHIDVVINLAGATLNKRWTDSYKQLIMTSRIQSTQALVSLFEQRSDKPEVLFNASAMGYYPPDINRSYTELYQTSPFDFLSDVVYQWERFAKKFEQFGTRVILGRFSMILSDDGGALQTMELPYKFFVGGKLGSGFQWYSWIHIDDLVRAILFTIDEPDAAGPFNFAAPIAERQNLFGYTLGRAMHRPHETWVPAFVLRTVLGEMSTVALDTQKVLPNKLEALGFQFSYPHLKSALDDLVQ
ncbi:TIGR01777 family oxidoreductase [Staphylococcus lugdunensis]|uniref:TIGR01777 family oxidoreductase n=1 Tax=Staphylococcus TaxID=1279 RepID=UPI0008A2A7DB|nr:MULTISPECIES: TIGR01777 family oxidoreductase [Staphylococcus]ARJ14563.1 TIGR01777 family protein [Staphylococcus lugdunensis]MCH8665897.1 TIGR01777 family oxidoreductase [Staphylococcus lugdunensis]OFJ65416.1 epimerase [Staphylococcus sp. HMSC077E11]OFM43280.1 epimerase [Staphylococcus sp. HMSC077E12]OFR90457.1 epimerase [Staphylococcus sp. HMSC059F04]